jgi:outer membrane lipoprotein-sorting protein
VVLSLGLVLAFPAAGPAAEGPLSLPRLIAGLARETSTTVRFSEERRLQYLTEPLFLEGTLSFEPPGRLEKQVLRPKREKMIVDGNLLIIESNRENPPVRVLLSDHPVLDAFVIAFRAILKGDHETLERIYTTALEGGEAAWLLRLTPRARQLREAVSEVRIAGGTTEITSIEVIEVDGDRSIYTISGKI